MSAEPKRPSFKERAKLRLGLGFRLRNRSANDVDQSGDPSNSSEVDGDVSLHGHINPLPWEQLSPQLPERLDMTNRPPEGSDNIMSVLQGMSPPRMEGLNEGREKKKKQAVQPKGTLVYKVEERDTLNCIALSFDTTPSELKKLNGLMMASHVFPGQSLFVPDKDYIPSPPASPVHSSTPVPVEQGGTNTTTTAKPDLMNRRSIDVPLVALSETSAKPEPAAPSGDRDVSAIPKVLSEEEARRLDQECYARFIKVNVKHITDGQGVVSGVLLVTPNAIMFDPNVSDPLVIEHGADIYGMIAPMETVISAAMYHDIAAMKLKGVPRPDNKEKHKVYHAAFCPMAQVQEEDVKTDAVDAPEPSNEDQPQPESAASRASLKRTESMCSCGALSMEARSGPDLLSEEEVKPRESVPDVLGDLPADSKPDEVVLNQDLLDLMGELATAEAPSDVKQASDMTQADTTEQTTPVEVSTPQGQGTPQGASQDASQQSGGNSQYFKYDSDTVKEVSGSGEVSSEAAPISIDTATTDSPSPHGGILSRTIGSLSSLGSTISSNSPNFSTFVDFSSGLFTRDSKDNVRDISEVSQSPPSSAKEPSSKTTWFVDDPKVEDTSAVSPKRNSRRWSNNSDISVENVVKLGDKPELFQSLDELIPKPASLFEDPPLYLCLRVGKPINKTAPKTGPIESYVKKRPKSEYWFSIPREMVDPLYAFFVQWSPSIYGGDDEIDPAERGFVVIDENEESEEEEDVEDGNVNLSGKDTKRLKRQMTKDWELVNLEEARRRLSMAEDECSIMPEMSDTSTLLNEEHIKKLTKHLPPRCVGYPWLLVYSSDRNGFSLQSLYRSMMSVDTPVLLAIKDTNNQVFGAMCSCRVRQNDHFYGTGQTYLYTFYPEFKRFNWTGNNNFFIRGELENLAFGAGDGHFGLWMDSNLYHGRTQKCLTFDNDPLTESSDFIIKGLEVWGFM